MSKGKYESNGRYRRRRRTFGSKSLALVLACVLLVGGVIGGTVAWLTAKTNQVNNVFTTSDITVELKEHEYDPEKDELKTTTTTSGVSNYKMIPGWTIPEDPWATVSADSEDCYLFIEVEETGGNVTVGTTTYDFDDFIDYAVKTGDSGWTALTGYSGVYYKVIDTAEEKGEGAKHYILGAGTYDVDYSWADNQVLTKPTVTKEMMAAVNDSNKPTLSFTAYAVQLWKSNEPESGASAEQISAAQFSEEDAWKKTPGYTAPSGN